MPIDWSLAGGSITPDWFRAFGSDISGAMDARWKRQREQQTSSDLEEYIRSMDYAAALGAPSMTPPDLQNPRIDQAFDVINASGGETGARVPERMRAIYEVAGKRTGQTTEQVAARDTSDLGFVPEQYREHTLAMARKYNLDPVLFARKIEQESRWNPTAVSPAGAQGIAQFMPGTAKEFGLADPFDWKSAIEASARYDARTKRDLGDRPDLILAAYNAGPDRAKDYLAGRPLPPETRDYISKIQGRMGTSSAPASGDVSYTTASGGLPTGMGTGTSDTRGGYPSRDTLIQMARNPELRPMVIDILKEQRKGRDPSKLMEVSPGASLYNLETKQWEGTAPGKPEGDDWTLTEIYENGQPRKVWANKVTQEIRPVGDQKAPSQSSGLTIETLPDGTTRVTQGPQKLTEIQGKYVSFHRRMQDSEQLIKKIEAEGYDPTSWRDKLAAQGGDVGNYFATPEGQRYRAAAKQWISGILRLDTGAALAPHEFDFYFNTYFAQPNDDLETVKFKEGLRRTAAQGIREASGGIVDQIQQGAPPPSGGIPPDVSPEEWSAMTDEERALWQ